MIALLVLLAPGAHAQTLQNVVSPLQTLAFEDVATLSSDEDHNDVVLRYRRQCTVDLSGQLVRETLRFSAVAAGASLSNSLLYTLASPADSVTIRRAGEADEPVTPASTVTIYADFRDAFFGSPGGFVNTAEGLLAYEDGRLTEVEVHYTAGTRATVGATCPIPALTVQAGAATPIGLTSTIGPNDRPLAGNFTGDWEAPTEHTSIATAYPDFLCWVDGCAGTTACTPSLWFDCPAAGQTHARPGLDDEAPVPVFSSCSDGTQNQDETGVDCGGETCLACADLVSVSPASAVGGTQLTLTGTGLLGTDTVTIGGVACAITYVSSTTLKCDLAAWAPANTAVAAVLTRGANVDTVPAAFTRTPTTTVLTAASGNWTAPLGVTSVAYKMWGGGGGGGGVSTLHTASAGGGGYSAGSATVTGGSTYPYEVGQGGPHGACNVHVRGGNGTPSTMFSHTANGGQGGAPHGSIAGNQGAGGIGETANGNPGLNDPGLSIPGGKGGGPEGGAGGVANGSSNPCGHTDGTGQIPGGGGSGRYGTNTHGGDGARGEIRLTY